MAFIGNQIITINSLLDLDGQELVLDADADSTIHVSTDDQIDFKIGGTDVVTFTNSSSDFVITQAVQDKDIIFKGDDGGSAIEAARFDMDVGGFLGLGTTSPSSRLNIVGDTFTKSTIRLERTNNGENNDAGLQFKSAAGANSGYGMGGIWFQNSLDDNAYALIRARTDDSTGTSGRLDFITSTSAVSNSTAASMTIDSSGNVGIGTTSPSNVLHVHQSDATSNSYVHITQEDGGSSGTDGLSIGIEDGGVNAVIRNRENGYLRMYTDNTERMRIDSNGKVLIGRTSAGNTGNGHSIRGSDSAIFSRDASGETMQVCRNDSTGDLIQFRRNGTICGEIVNNGSTSVAYQTSSDYRLKENVKTLANGIERIKELKPYRFNFIAEPKKIVDGFFAHEAQTVVPECASGKKDEVDENGEPVMQGIDQSKLVPLLTKALQEAVSEIDTLKEKVTALESK